MTTIAVTGAAGRMGSRIITLAREAAVFQVVAAIERPDHPMLERDAGEVAGAGKIGVPISIDLQPTPQVLIDFLAMIQVVLNGSFNFFAGKLRQVALNIGDTAAFLGVVGDMLHRDACIQDGGTALWIPRAAYNEGVFRRYETGNMGHQPALHVAEGTAHGERRHGRLAGFERSQSPS